MIQTISSWLFSSINFHILFTSIVESSHITIPITLNPLKSIVGRSSSGLVSEHNSKVVLRNLVFRAEPAKESNKQHGDAVVKVIVVDEDPEGLGE
jgi:hypothetical protein